MAVLGSAALYTFLVTFIGHWFLHQPVSQTIREGFGDERFGWLLLGVSIDLIGRLYSLFDPD